MPERPDVIRLVRTLPTGAHDLNRIGSLCVSADSSGAGLHGHVSFRLFKAYRHELRQHSEDRSESSEIAVARPDSLILVSIYGALAFEVSETFNVISGPEQNFCVRKI